MQQVPIWVKFPGLPLKYWGEKSLFKIAGIIWKVIKMDQATKRKEKLLFARVLVEVGLKQDLPETIEF